MASNNEGSAFLRLDFYDGAYGPTLRIDIPSRKLLEALKAVFQNLAEEKVGRTDLTKADFVCPGNVSRLELVLQEQTMKLARSKALTLHRGTEFVWTNSADGWQYCVDLLGGFGEQPGHQYLTAEGIDDALIEAAFLEH